MVTTLLVDEPAWLLLLEPELQAAASRSAATMTPSCLRRLMALILRYGYVAGCPARSGLAVVRGWDVRCGAVAPGPHRFRGQGHRADQRCVLRELGQDELGRERHGRLERPLQDGAQALPGARHPAAYGDPHRVDTDCQVDQ